MIVARLRLGKIVAFVGFVVSLGLAGAGQEAQAPKTLSVQITSPLGRTGIAEPIRIVARVTLPPNTTLGPVQFFVDGKLIGEDKDGPPYAVEWTDSNPFEAREIVVQVADSQGHTARDSVSLKPLEMNENTSVSSVLLEPLVLDAKGRPVNSLTEKDFRVFEDGVPQNLDLAVPDTVPATYTLLVDSSQSMWRRMDFVQDAARELPKHLRPSDRVLIAPFSLKLGAVTGPTKDRDTIADAIGAIKSAGGTAILDCLAEVAQQINGIEGRHIVVLITDGYDENSKKDFDQALEAIKATQATVYVVAIGGSAGISLKGEDLLRRIAVETGGRAFFPSRDEQLVDDNALIAADVQQRYVVTYTPLNQKIDGTWRSIKVTTPDPTHIVRVRSGYFAPSPPPVRPQIELTIRDTNREYVDVTSDDLTVVEDGVEQSIEGFEEAVSPVSILLTLDASGSMRPGASQVKEAARTFVGALPQKDSLGIVQFADKPMLVQDLSTKRDASLEAIDQYQTSGGTALYDAMIESLTRLKRVQGRRMIVLLTDGRDENNAGTAAGSTHTFDEVLALIREVGATVFSIGLGRNIDRLYLEKMAELSGGEAYFPDDVSSLETNYRRILENLRRRYVITYTSTNPNRDGTWRKVDVRSRRTEIVVESKGGYFAPLVSDK